MLQILGYYELLFLLFDKNEYVKTVGLGLESDHCISFKPIIIINYKEHK